MIYEAPFRHAVIDGFLSRETVRKINAEWPTEWTREEGKGTVKWSTEELPPTARHIQETFDTSLVEEITGVSGLFQDPDRFGSGLHCIPRGGFLKMHIDFNVHPKGWHRRANVLIYLNEEWEDAWGGHLELGENRSVKVAPIGGRCVIFETTEHSWHGHPDPLNCPEWAQRRSLAIYFYTDTKPADRPHTTIYKR